MMKYMFQSTLFIGLFIFGVAHAGHKPSECIELSGSEVLIPSRLGTLQLYKDADGFYITKGDEIYDIPNYNCDQMLREICARNQLKSFLGRNKPSIILITPEEFDNVDPQNIIEISEVEKKKLVDQILAPCGYISVNQMDNGEYVLRAHMRLLGGVRPGDVVLAGGAGLAGGGLAATGTVAAAGAMSGAVGTAVTTIPSVAALEAAIPGLAAALSMAPGSTLAGAGGSILATGTTQTLLGAGLAVVGWPVVLGIVGVGGLIGLTVLLVQSTSTSETPPGATAQTVPVNNNVHQPTTQRSTTVRAATTQTNTTVRTAAAQTNTPVATPATRANTHEMINREIRDQLRETIRTTAE